LTWNGQVADGQHLVDEQDLRLGVHRHREPEPDAHPRGVELDRGVEEVLDAGEGDDRVHLPVDLGPRHPEDRAVDEDVLPAAQLGVEADADRDQRRDAPAHPHLPLGRGRDAAQHLQQGRLARAVAAR
jgi:hypothetical protein